MSDDVFPSGKVQKIKPPQEITPYKLPAELRQACQDAVNRLALLQFALYRETPVELCPQAQAGCDMILEDIRQLLQKITQH